MLRTSIKVSSYFIRFHLSVIRNFLAMSQADIRKINRDFMLIRWLNLFVQAINNRNMRIRKEFDKHPFFSVVASSLPFIEVDENPS